MAQSDFEQGFLSALSSFGIKGEDSGGVSFPDISKLAFVNCDYYRGDIGEGATYLSDTEYLSVFSSGFYYVPQTGGIVMMGGYQLQDWDYWGDETPRAMLRITADDIVIYEGEVSNYFDNKTVDKARAFRYKRSFDIAGKRLNLTESMALEVFSTMIIGYK